MQKEREQILQSWLHGRQVTVRSFIRRSALFGIGQYVLVVVQSALLAWIAHQVVMAGEPPTAMVWPFLGLLAAAMGRAACAGARELSGQRAGEQLRRELRSEILARMAQQGPAILAQRSSGSWLTLVMEQVDKLHDYYARYLPQMLLVRVLPLLTIALVLPFSWVAALILLVTAPLIVLFMILVGNRAAAASRRNVQALSRLSAHFLDRLQGLATLRLFLRSQAEQQAVAAAAESFREKTMQVLRLAFLSSTVLEFFTAVSIAITAVYLGMSFLGHLNFGFWGEPLTLAVGLFLLLLAPEYYLPLRELGTHYHAKADALGAADELEQFLREPVASDASDNCLPCPHVEAAAVSFRNVTVTTAAGRAILDDVSFDLLPGQTLAIVGQSGAGKTTLLNVLLGFMPYQGEVLINGVSLASLQGDSWRRQVAWLGQNPRLFSGTLLDNIRLGSPETPAEQLQEVMAMAHIDEFMERLPQGLDTAIGDDAAGLSVGQAQRIALARALLNPFQLLVLDEPTASLDQHSADIVSRAVARAAAQRTVITVSHRQESLQGADQILMLDRGRVLACGSQAELYEHSREFRQLQEQWQQWQTWQNQSGSQGKRQEATDV